MQIKGNDMFLLTEYEENKYYWFNYTKPVSKKNYFYLFLIVFGIISLCLFPVWPLNLKLGIWWILVMILVLLILIIVIRIVVYTTGFIFGYDIWFMPNVLNDNTGLFVSFSPIVAYHKRTDDEWLDVLFRISLLMVGLSSSIWLYYNSSWLVYIWEIIVWCYRSCVDWGYEKMYNLHYGGSQVNINSKYSKRQDYSQGYMK